MSDPVAVSNLVRRVRRDGYRLYYEAGKAQLIAQVREGKHSISAIARVNDVNSNLLQKWIAACGSPKIVRTKPADQQSGADLLPIKLMASLTPPQSHVQDQIEVRCKRGTIMLAATAINLNLLLEALSA